MRTFHWIAVLFHGCVALPFFAFLYVVTGDWFCGLMAGWSVFFGALSLSKLRGVPSGQ
jgi:hypothetical protein